jgi:hypothetical protein
MRGPPRTDAPAGTAIPTGAASSDTTRSTSSVLRQAGTVKQPSKRKSEPYSYVLTGDAIDRIAERDGTSPREFVEALLRSGIAVCEGSGLRIWPNGGRP